MTRSGCKFRLAQPLLSTTVSAMKYSPGSVNVCVAVAPLVLSTVPSSKFQTYSASVNPGSANDPSSETVISSPRQRGITPSGKGWTEGELNSKPEVGLAHGVVQEITASKPSLVTIDDILQFYVPTAFTPNNDGLNDVLRFEGADIDPTRFKVQIFNRNGELLFESTDPSTPWTGNILGGEHYAQNGAYNWTAIVVSKSTGAKKELNGSFIIMR